MQIFDVANVNPRIIPGRSFLDSGNILSGKHFKITCVNALPVSILNQDGHLCGGMLHWFYKHTSQNLNFTYTIKILPGSGQKLANGTWTLMLGDVQNGKADIGCVSALLTDRYKEFDMTSYLYELSGEFLMALPDTSVNPKVLLTPFNPDVWIVFLVSLCIATSLLFFILARNLKVGDRKYFASLYIAVSSPIAMFAQQSVTLTRRARKFLPLLGLWLFYSLIMSTAYKSKMFISIAFPRLEEFPKNLLQLAKMPDWKISYGYWPSAMFYEWKASTNPLEKSLFDRLVMEPDRTKCILEAFFSPKTVCIEYGITLISLAAKNLSLRANFDSVLISKSRIFQMWVGTAFPKGSLYRDKFSEVVSKYRESGLVWKTIGDVYNNLRVTGREWLLQSKCSDVYQKLDKIFINLNQPFQSLRLQNLTVFFIFHLICCMVSLACFLIEICLKISRTSRRFREVVTETTSEHTGSA
ncbi:unnamed protein product [Allacma fusca]|uniref:Uncharacterized protein n=1 Tax=Allacma fusca TaxID=39272 RepID=A0A8J2IZG4_9HEXA|nr:unnamed protein product [Allacma fusca]